jgi:hypothetical protein
MTANKEDRSMNGAQPSTQQRYNPHERFHRFFDRIAANGFYGKISVSLQNGRITDVRVEQTRKLDEL